MELNENEFHALLLVMCDRLTDKDIEIYSDELNDLCGKQLGMIENAPESAPSVFRLTEKGRCYESALNRVNLPEQIWIVR